MVNSRPSSAEKERAARRLATQRTERLFELWLNWLRSFHAPFFVARISSFREASAYSTCVARRNCIGPDMCPMNNVSVPSLSNPVISFFIALSPPCGVQELLTAMLTFSPSDTPSNMKWVVPISLSGFFSNISIVPLICLPSRVHRTNRTPSSSARRKASFCGPKLHPVKNASADRSRSAASKTAVTARLTLPALSGSSVIASRPRLSLCRGSRH
jgi:hypothetical protein